MVDEGSLEDIAHETDSATHYNTLVLFTIDKRERERFIRDSERCSLIKCGDVLSL